MTDTICMMAQLTVCLSQKLQDSLMMEADLVLEPTMSTSLARPRLNRQGEQSSGQTVNQRDLTSSPKPTPSKMSAQVLTT